jgi:ariadne-1
MDLDDVNSRLKKIVKELSELLGTSDDDTLILFHHYKWNKNKLENSEYFSDPNKIRAEAGLMPLDYNSVKPTDKEFQCPICWNVISISELDAPDCGHSLCNDCWEDYLKEKVIYFLFFLLSSP